VTQKVKKDEFIFPFEKLEVWQCAVDLADYVLNLMESFPVNKHYRLIGQMEAAVSSVAQNIAEGSLFEVLTLTEIFKRRKLIRDHAAKEIRRQAEIIDRKLHGLINSLRGRF
jgi:hypothetical protein